MEFVISQPKMVRLPRNKKQAYRLNSTPQMWPLGLTLVMTLTLNFQGQIWNLRYLSKKWSDCHKMKSKHIDWTLGLKCDQWVWLWPWTWPLNFQSQMWPWPLTTGGGDRSFMTMTVTKVRCKDLPDSDRVTSDVGVPSTHLIWGKLSCFWLYVHITYLF